MPSQRAGANTTSANNGDAVSLTPRSNCVNNTNTNSDGKIDASDEKFNELKVWVDADSDGVTGAGDLKSLDDLGILSMDLGASRGTETDNGNLLGLDAALFDS